MAPPPVPSTASRHGSFSSTVPRPSLSDRLRSLPFSVSKLNLSIQRSPRRPSDSDKDAPPIPSTPDAQLLYPTFSQRASHESHASVTRDPSPIPRRSTSTPMLRMLSRTPNIETEAGLIQSMRGAHRQRSPGPDDPDPAYISRVFTPDDDPFAKADVVAVDFVDPFSPSACASTTSLAIGRSHSPLVRRSRDAATRPLQMHIDAAVDPLQRPEDETSTLVSPAPTAMSFASNDAYAPSSASHSNVGHTLSAGMSPSPSYPPSSFVFPSRSPKRLQMMSPRTQQIRNKDLPDTPPVDQTPREKKLLFETSVKPLHFVAPSPPRRGSVPIVSVGGFPVLQKRLEAPTTKERGGSVASIWPSKASIADGSLAPLMDDTRRLRFRDRLGSAFKFGTGPRPKSTASSSSATSSSSFCTPGELPDRVVSSAPPGKTLFPFVHHSGYITPASMSPKASPDPSTVGHDTPVPYTYTGESIHPVARVSSLKETPTLPNALGIRSLRPPPSDQRRSRSLSPHPPSQHRHVLDPPLSSDNRPSSPSLSACGGPLRSPVRPAFIMPVTHTMSPSVSSPVEVPSVVQLEESAEPPARTRNGSFPFEVARQLSLGDLDLMFTPRSIAVQESFMALDDSGAAEDGDAWLYGEREAWERASARTSVVSESSIFAAVNEDDENSENEWDAECLVANDLAEAANVPTTMRDPGKPSAGHMNLSSSSHLDMSWQSDPSSSLISSTSSLGLAFTDPWISMRPRLVEADGVTIASSEGTVESLDSWPLPPKRAVVIGQDGTAWTQVEPHLEYFSPQAHCYSRRHQVQVAPRQASECDSAESHTGSASSAPASTMPTPALTAGELSPMLMDGDIDTPTSTFDAWGFPLNRRTSVGRSDTVQSYLSGAQAAELAQRFVPIAHNPLEDEDTHPIVAPLRIRKRQSVASAYFSARSRPSTAGSVGSMDNAIGPLTIVHTSPKRVSKIEEEVVNPEDSGVFVDDISMAAL